MIKVKIVKVFFISLMLITYLSFSDRTFARDCDKSSSGQGMPSITSNHHYPPDWFEMEQELTLPNNGQIVNTNLIPAGASVNVHISGVVGFWRGLSYGSDAAYIYYVPPGTRHYPVTTPLRSLNIITSNGRFDPKSYEYNSNHEYDWQTIGPGQSMTIHVGDSNYDDNAGSFSVTVSW